LTVAAAAPVRFTVPVPAVRVPTVRFPVTFAVPELTVRAPPPPRFPLTVRVLHPTVTLAPAWIVRFAVVPSVELTATRLGNMGPPDGADGIITSSPDPGTEKVFQLAASPHWAVPAKAVQVVWAKTIPGGAKKTIQTNTGRIDIPKNRGLLPRRFFRARLRYGFISAYKDTTGAENFT